MDYVKLGTTGVKVSPIILGTMQFGWRVDQEESFAVMDRALELGINCFDTADVYSYWAENSYAGRTEEIIGRWMEDRGTRDDLVLATKLKGAMSNDINNRGLSRRHVHQAIAGSLERLQTDWIDLYQIHSFDQDTNIDETLHALNLLIDDGRVNYIGASNIPAWMMIEAYWKAEVNGYQRFETFQPPFSIVRRIMVEQDFVEISRKYGMGILPYSPLAGGFLTGKYKRDADLPDTPRSNAVASRYFTEKRWNILEKVEAIAKEHDATIPQIALAWVISRDFITAPIIGANSVEQLEENVGALEIELTEDNLNQLDKVSSWQEEWNEIR